jgi:hypothetical protein
MNPFQRISEALGLTCESQGEQGWLHLVLSLAADKWNNEQPDIVLTNPVAEALRLLSIYHPCHAFDRAQAMLNTLRERFDR